VAFLKKSAKLTELSLDILGSTVVPTSAKKGARALAASLEKNARLTYVNFGTKRLYVKARDRSPRPSPTTRRSRRSGLG
jgi:hypothetical protein